MKKLLQLLMIISVFGLGMFACQENEPPPSDIQEESYDSTEEDYDEVNGPVGN